MISNVVGGWRTRCLGSERGKDRRGRCLGSVLRSGMGRGRKLGGTMGRGWILENGKGFGMGAVKRESFRNKC